jgi:alkyldihydroxyacetonephosphate synthase
MNKKSTNFQPDWYQEAPPEGSYRSILKWGDPLEFKHPNQRLYELMKQVFHMTDEDFKNKEKMGLEKVSYNIPIKLKPEQVNFFKNLSR